MLPVLAVLSSLSSVTDIASDPIGGAWLATTGGLVQLNAYGAPIATDTRLRGLDQVRDVHGLLYARAGKAWFERDTITGRWTSVAAGPAAPEADSAAEFDEATLFDGLGRRSATLPDKIAEVLPIEIGSLVRTAANTVWVVGPAGADPLILGGPCGNFVTGLTRWKGDLVVATFDHGACVEHEGRWTALSTPSTMVNEVLAVPTGNSEVLWMATAEGLVRVDNEKTEVFGAIQDGQPKSAPGLNHIGANHVAWDGDALWVADVLGPTKIVEEGGKRTWTRYRWSVSGHSYQTVAACGKSVWAGSEDDGLAERGVALGSRNGKSDWHHVNALDGLPEDWIMATACAGSRSAWVGTYRNGVGKVDATGWHAVAGLEGTWVQTMAVQGDILWVGTADGVYRVRDGKPERVSNEDTWSILLESGRVLLGTRTGIVVLPTE